MMFKEKRAVVRVWMLIYFGIRGVTVDYRSLLPLSNLWD